MTIDEAIERLKTDIYKYADFKENPNENEFWAAFDMAIKALEQEPEDAISRADALKALDYDIKSFEFKSGVSKHMNEIANLLNTIYEIQSDNIKALPSVRPKYNANEWCHDCSEYNHEKHCCPRYNNVIRNAVEEIKQPKTGHWISYWDEEARCYVYKCPECGNKQPFDTKHCWECGTRMIEPQESEAKE